MEFNLPDFGFQTPDVDFDLNDFEIVTEPLAAFGQSQQRIIQPRIAKGELTKAVLFENAQQFAEQIDLSGETRTYAWIDGSFVFGDIVEALVTQRNVGVKNLYIASLSFSQENVDSLKNVMILMGDALERIVLVMSGYQYSHEKYGLVPYMYQELDDPKNRVQIAFGGWHTKIITLETPLGNTLTIHGSANLRSSNSIEQIMVEVNNRELHEFNAGIMDEIAQQFGTINHSVDYHKFHRIEGKEAWEVCKQWHQDQQQ